MTPRNFYLVLPKDVYLLPRSLNTRDKWLDVVIHTDNIRKWKKLAQKILRFGAEECKMDILKHLLEHLIITHGFLKVRYYVDVLAFLSNGVDIDTFDDGGWGTAHVNCNWSKIIKERNEMYQHLFS